MEKKTRKKSAIVTTIVIITVVLGIIAVILYISNYFMNVAINNDEDKYKEEQQEQEEMKRNDDNIFFKVDNKYVNQYGYITNISNNSAIQVQGINISDTQERLSENSLEILNELINLRDVLESNEMLDKVSKIDVTNIIDVKIYMDSENKIVEIGNCDNLSAKFVWIHTLLEQEKGVSGTIVVKDINDVYFTEVYNKENENG